MVQSEYIFLSYRSLEVELGLKLTTDLKNVGIRVWMDRLEIRPADDWVNALSKGVDDCTAMIAIISPEYLKSQYCCRELHRADRLNRVVFPVLLHPIEELGFPIELERKQFIDFSDWKTETRYQEQLTRLIEAIKGRFGNLIQTATLTVESIPEAKLVAEPIAEPVAEPIAEPLAEPLAEPIVPAVPKEKSTETDIVGDVLSKLSTGDCQERQAAARALRNYALVLKNGYSANILKRLLVALTDENWTIRLLVIETIAVLGAKDAIPALIPLLKDAHQTVRMTAIRAIGLLGTSDDADVIAPLLTDKNSLVREAAIQTLGVLGNPKTIAALLPILGDKEAEMRLYAIEALGKIGDKSVVEALILCLKAGDEKVRWVCIEALQRLGDARAVSALRLCLTDERHPIWDDKRVCDVALEALATMNTPEASEAIAEWHKKQSSLPK
ncbi:MAG: HEAT repeat domain-containing protein [bacterium]|nr:HEAT repeat domain-containing protein [bacterium]